MTVATLPAKNSTDWFQWATDVDSIARSLSAAIFVDQAPYNAKGDGVTDDYAAITAAIAALPTSGGHLVFTDGKTYLSSATLKIANRQNVKVDLGTATILNTSTNVDNGAVLYCNNIAGVQVWGGNLGHKNASTRKNAADGLTFEQCSDFLAIGVRVNATYSMGIRAAGSTRGTLSKNTVTNTLADGIGCYPGERYSAGGDGAITAGSAVVTSSTTYFQQHDVGSRLLLGPSGDYSGDVVGTIASVQSPTQVTLAATSASSFSGRFVRLLRPASAVTISDNHIFNSGDDGISAVSYLFAGGQARDIAVIGNTVERSQARGILFCGTKNSVASTNTVRDSAMAGLYCVTEIAGGNLASYGCTNILLSTNEVENTNTNYPTDNYPAIGAGSADDNYPILGLRISNNIISGAFSYYIEVGAYGSYNTAASSREIVVDGNQCYGGNANQPGMYFIRTTNVTASSNRISRARTSAIAFDSTCAGTRIARDNELSNWDRIGQGFGPIDAGAGAIIINNVLNGVLVASGTSGAGANPGGSAA